ncbi:DUF676-domain-containing protein [Dacryopinax primogenitus]|uniref:DUF676-domain-containing protein n=1 Tax=Dacryopinax primogenitus (strain DJM 731) TaxID=1858805 RepID=M5GEP4_DACPD|nr:DUF676-domain-containing protein [Dacryopinax primogenitus]EJU03453.1 DUF676-domain-containing protein [Dacryopinax primogenitus]
MENTSPTPASVSPQPVHLVLLVHGMWGDPQHLSNMASRLREQFPASSIKPGQPLLDVLVAEANRGNHTYDGVDWGAERVADEFLSYVDKLEREGKVVQRLSIVGYSLGGLIARYLIGILETRNFFSRVEPRAFYTFATPHIGLPRYPSFYSSLTYTLGPRFLSRTGEQFYAIDQWGTSGRPLLEVMADPQGVFYRGLARFARREVYANAAGDVTVPYVTSAIEVHDPFFHYQSNGIQLEFDPKHPHMITKWELPVPVEKPQLAIMSWEYLRSLYPTRPVLPPHLQFSYPYNYVFFALSPLLVPFVAPIILLALVYRFSAATRESRRRIALLESDSEWEDNTSLALSRRPTLMSLSMSGWSTPTSSMEQGSSESTTPAPTPSPPMNGNNNNALTLPKPATSSSSASLLQLATLAATSDGSDGPLPAENALAASAGEQPMLTSLQLRCAEQLNKLGWGKKLVLIEGVRNAHGPLICRAAFQMQGKDVLDVWAEGFGL